MKAITRQSVRTYLSATARDYASINPKRIKRAGRHYYIASPNIGVDQLAPSYHHKQGVTS